MTLMYQEIKILKIVYLYINPTILTFREVQTKGNLHILRN